MSADGFYIKKCLSRTSKNPKLQTAINVKTCNWYQTGGNFTEIKKMSKSNENRTSNTAVVSQ